MTHNILDVSSVSRRFGSTKAVDNVSFSVRRGEIMGLLGPNGAGKTTAIRMIMGILEPDQGTIRFQLNGSSGRVNKKRIGYLPEERGLYYEAKVLDNLLYLAGLKGYTGPEAKKEALAWLQRLDLTDWAHQKLEKLSKGMQQKVQFTAALLHRPDLIMLDEPFSGLDPINQNFFKELIQELQAQGVTVLLSAHQMSVVEELCDSLVMIHQGRVVLSGTLQHIKDNYEEKLLDIRFGDSADNGTVDRLLEALPGSSLAHRQGQRLTLRCRGPVPAAELVSTASRFLNIQECAVKKPPLHDIFVETVKRQGGDIDAKQLA